MKRINLMEFGIEVIGYTRDSDVVRFFVKPFSGFWGFAEPVLTATEREIFTFLKTKENKRGKLTEAYKRMLIQQGLVNEQGESLIEAKRIELIAQVEKQLVAEFSDYLTETIEDIKREIYVPSEKPKASKPKTKKEKTVAEKIDKDSATEDIL